MGIHKNTGEDSGRQRDTERYTYIKGERRIQYTNDILTRHINFHESYRK